MTTAELLARLEAESTFGDEINAWISGTRKALEAIQRVRELHKPSDSGKYCDHCEIGFVDGYENLPYPCPTIQALDGEQS